MRLRTAVFCFVLAWGIASGARADDLAVLTTTDYSSGSLASVNLSSLQAQVNLLNIHSDAIVRTYQGKVYVVNRLGQDNVVVLDPADLTHPLLQFSVGNGSNPQDIAFASPSKAYVARLGSPRLLVVNPATGDSTGSIDLSFAADADGEPEAALLATYDGRLYVTCQRLNENAYFAPTDYSEVVVVDMATDTVVDADSTQAGVQGIVLKAKDPLDEARVGSKLYLSCTGTFGDLTDGGIEVVDLAANRTEGVALTGGDLGGNPGAIAMSGAGQGYVVVSDASFVNAVKKFDLGAHTVGARLQGLSGGYVPAIASLKDRLYVSDQGSTSSPAAVGLQVFDTVSGAHVAGPISTGLPPDAIAFVVPEEAADFNGDGVVDFSDFLLFARAYSNTGTFDPAFDLNGDGKLNFDDFVVFARDFGYGN